MRAIAVAIALASPPMHAHAAEIAVRFFDDNAAAQGAALSTRAHAEVEKAAGATLLALGRDDDGAFRFGLAHEPRPAQLRDIVNRLRATGALVYADVVRDARSALAKQYAGVDSNPVTSVIVKPKFSAKKAFDGARAATVAAKASVAVAGARPLADGSQVITFATPLSARDAQAVVAALAADDSVAHVEIDRRATTQAQPADPLYASQWNLNDPVGGIAAPRAWDVTTGDPHAPIAVLDTGILPHPDLANRVVAGYDFIADANFSNDGDGRDADPSDPGDFVSQAESTTPGSALQGCATTNSTWHGTMVAGTLGASVNNGSGVSGINWKSPIVNVRVLGKCGGALSDVADGIRWAAGAAVPGVPVNPRPARVINLSLAGSGECGPILQSAVTDATARGAIVVAAAGNDNGDVANTWPANCNGVIAVAATSKNGSRAFYSNSGTRIAVSAPGGGVGGSIPVLRNASTTSPDPTGYGYGQQLGSSLAAPHVAGIASLLLAVDPYLTAAEVQAHIEAGARTFPTVATDPCSTSLCGAGIADATSTIARIAQNGITSPLTPEPAPGGGQSGRGGGTGESQPPGPQPAGDAPPPHRLPVEGGWRAKTPHELERYLKSRALESARGQGLAGDVVAR